MGIYLFTTSSAGAVKLTVTNSLIAGYRLAGIHAYGPVKFSLSSNTLDATGGGRVSTIGSAVVAYGDPGDTSTPTGSVDKSRLMRNYIGVRITSSSKISISGSTPGR